MNWYLPTVERQTGVEIAYEKSGQAFLVGGTPAIHIYRIVQEAINNVTRHSNAKQAWVRLRFLPDNLEIEVEDHGVGFTTSNGRQGIGLVAMRERAELLNGTIQFSRPAEGGTLVRLRVPKEAMEANA